MSLLNWMLERGDRAVQVGCKGLTRLAASHRTIMNGSSKYLTRYYLTRKQHESDVDAKGKFSVYLHYFHRGDEDASLHNHPWQWSFSLILTNGYIEERWNDQTQKIDTREIRPGDLNVIRANDFHRVDLRDPSKGAWTIFVTGPRVQSWGFWWPGVHSFIPWHLFQHSNTDVQRTN